MEIYCVSCDKEVHRIIDEYWLPTKDRRKRKELYADISEFIGREYHTGELNTIAECKAVIEYHKRNYECKVIITREEIEASQPRVQIYKAPTI